MKCFKNVLLFLVIYLCLSSHLLAISHKNTEGRSSRLNAKKATTVTRTCVGGWKYFLGGMFYNGAVDSAGKLSLFEDKNIEQCVDSAVNTVYDFMTSWNKKAAEFEKKQPGVISKCLGDICWLAKQSSKFVLATVVTGALTIGTKDTGLSLSDIGTIFSSTFKGAEIALDKLEKFWKDNASPFVPAVVHFFENSNISDTISTLFSCVGREKAFKFLAQMGLKLLDYFIDSPLTQIGKTVLKGAETALNTYEKIHNDPIGGPVLDTLEVLSYFTPAGAVRGAVGKVVVRKLAKDTMRREAGKNIARVTKGALGSMAKIAKVGVKYFENFVPEVGWLIYNLIRDIQALVVETDDCKRSTLWGKIFYKALRLAKTAYSGSGFFNIVDAGSALITDKVLEDLIDAGSPF